MKAIKSENQLLKISKLADELQGSEIIKLAADIRAKIAEGHRIYNYTIGDFDPTVFPIPKDLEKEIIKAYHERQTNYPPSNGMESLRSKLSEFIGREQKLNYAPFEFVIAGGGRPLIYATYQTIVDAGDKVIFPVPSWNNNHYCGLNRCEPITIVTKPENNFMPTAAEIEPHIHDAALIALCSPLNPTGTVFSKDELEKICRLIVEENKRREGIKKPLYLMFDQIYWQICFGDTVHYNPVSIVPEMRSYTIFIDGISKAFAATGVRVGWAFGPEMIIKKMSTLLGHMGAWAPKPEQVATAKFLALTTSTNEYMEHFKSAINLRLQQFYEALISMRNAGLPVDVIKHQAAMYLTVKIDLIGKITPDGKKIETIADTTEYLLSEAGLAIVPFAAFGAPENSPWYRLSVGTTKAEDIPTVIDKLESAIKRLK